MKLSPDKMREEYARWASQFWAGQTALWQIVEEEFPDIDGDDVPTRYHIDMMRGLAAAVGALVEGYDAGTD